MDQGLNSLLKWGIENSEASKSDPSAPAPTTSTSNLDPSVLQALLGGPSDADLMKDAMAAIQSPDVSLDNKITAFDNFEQLVEGIDNANNMEPLGLWVPLVRLLEASEKELRMYAAWCVGTAVQNNSRAQERLFVLNAIPTLVKMATGDPDPVARKKAILALSSGVRNYQPSLNKALESLPDDFEAKGKLDAEDMEGVDQVMAELRERSAKMG